MKVDERIEINARIAGAFRAASSATGVSFEQLARTASRESDFQPVRGSRTSSAKGLFQFVDQTWLELVKKEGASVGLDRMAAAITSDGKGGLTVADPQEKAKILALRTDPLVSSIMAGRFTKANTEKLTESLGRTPSEGEVYAAHVLGAAGAVKLVKTTTTEPTATASVVFPKAAAANPDLFYDKAGRPRTVTELSDRLTGGTGAAPSPATAPVTPAAAAGGVSLDPATLAAAVRAQVAAKVASEGVAGAGVDTATAARFAKTALAQTSLPGSDATVAPAPGARLDGWRARSPNDAFAMLMRSDGQSLTADAAAAAGPAGSAEVRALAEPGSIAAAHMAFADGGGIARHAAPAAVGAIPYVDPNQPLRLDPTATPAPTAATGSVATASVATADVRRSRLADRASIGAPGMPLPMVDGGTVVRGQASGATVPTAAVDPTATSGLVAPGAARVKTVSISLPTTAAAGLSGAGSTQRLPPVPGEAATAAATTAAPRRASGRPLDLLAVSRRAGIL